MSGDRRRLDIQGLRGIAVLLVVLYHAGLHVPGGFSGVDVFFVISGFVITATLLTDLESLGRIRLGRFYGRRIKRLLPALAVMVVVVDLLALVANPVASLHASAITGLTTSFFAANAQLYLLGNGYFDFKATIDPFLHTWSLAVEEQFYFVFPAAIAVAWGVGRRRLSSPNVAGIVVAAITVASFALAVELSAGHLLTDAHRPQQFAFYSSLTRAWEFGVGALLAFARVAIARIPGRAASVLSLAGAAAVIYGAFHLKTGTPPSYVTLYPVLGSAAMIAAGVGGVARSPVNTGLSTAPLRWIGDRSYSWYLWHWPFVVFATALFPGIGIAPPLAAALALLPAALSYTWVENPIRRSSSIAGRRIATLAFACIAVPAVFSLMLLGANSLLSRTHGVSQWRASQTPHVDVVNGCHDNVPLGADTPTTCTWHVPASRGTVVLVGDSNASQFSEAVIDASQRQKLNVTDSTFYSCPFVLIRVINDSGAEKPCTDFVQQSLRWIEKTRPNLVVIAARTDRYIETSSGPGRYSFGLYGGQPTYDRGEKARLYTVGLSAVLRRLDAAGIPSIVVIPIPRIPTQVATCAMVLAVTNNCAQSVSRASSDRELAVAHAALAAAVSQSKLGHLLDVTEVFCSATRCSGTAGGLLLYRDDEHLTTTGSLKTTEAFFKAFIANTRP